MTPGVCKKILSCSTGLGEVEVIKHGAGTTCDCAHGMGRMAGKCKTLFSSASCPPADILLPQKFSLEEDIETCPESFSCIEADECDIYSSARQEIEEKKGKVKEKLMNHTKSLICNKVMGKICCPEERGKSFFSTEMILKSFNLSSKTKCVKNPCPTTQWPWINEDGQSICSKHKDDVPSCEGVILRNQGLLECKLPGKQFIIAPKRTCGIRRRWSPFRQACVRLFG